MVPTLRVQKIQYVVTVKDIREIELPSRRPLL